jgi:hypothetical protein
MAAAVLGWLDTAAFAEEPSATKPPTVLTPPLDSPVPPVYGSTDLASAGKDYDGDHCQFFTGASVYVLKPYFESNTAFITTSGVGTTSPSRTESDFNWDYTASPAVFLGIVAPGGFGVRARYFSFDESSSNLHTTLTAAGATQGFIDPAPGLTFPAAAFGAPGILLAGGNGQDQLYFSSRLRIQTIDLEAMQQWRFGGYDLLLSGGGRYLELSQSYQATLTNSAVFPDGNTATELQSLAAGHNFQGGGVTLAIEGRRRFGESGLSLFANARGSLLVGTSHESSSLLESVRDPFGEAGGSQTVSPTTDAHRDHVLPVAEIELGLEYSLRVGSLEPFFRAAAVNQTYFDAGNASRLDGNLGLFGVAFTLGVRY